MATFQRKTAESVQRPNQDAPLPLAHDPPPGPSGHLCFFLLEPEDRATRGPLTEARKQQDLHGTGVALVSPTQRKVVIDEGDLGPDNSDTALQRPNATGVSCTQTQLQARAPPVASRCSPCRFAKV